VALSAICVKGPVHGRVCSVSLKKAIGLETGCGKGKGPTSIQGNSEKIELSGPTGSISIFDPFGREGKEDIFRNSYKKHIIIIKYNLLKNIEGKRKRNTAARVISKDRKVSFDQRRSKGQCSVLTTDRIPPSGKNAGSCRGTRPIIYHRVETV